MSSGWLPPILLALSAGCASTGVQELKTAPAKPDNCVLDTYRAESEVPRPFEALCTIDATPGREAFDDRTVQAAIEDAKPKACRCGADAIIVSQKLAPATPEGTQRSTVSLRAIRYTGPPLGTAPAESPGTSPAAGTERGPCYGNGTCNEGLTCASNVCVRLPEEERPANKLPSGPTPGP
jgi:hypothetical protein